MPDNAPIPAISIKQPWAELILRGEKTVEIRSWHTSYRGSLWLHTGKAADEYPLIEYRLRDPSMNDLFTGGFVGRIVLKAVLPFDQRSWEALRPQHLSAGKLHRGLYAFMLGGATRLSEPIDAPGELKVFDVSQQLHEELTRRLTAP